MTDKPQKQAPDDPLIIAWCSKCFLKFYPKSEGNGLYVRCTRCKSHTRNFSYDKDDLKKWVKVPVMCTKCNYFWMRSRNTKFQPTQKRKRKLMMKCPDCGKYVDMNVCVSYFRDQYAKDPDEINSIIMKKYSKGGSRIIELCMDRHNAFQNMLSFVSNPYPSQ